MNADAARPTLALTLYTREACPLCATLREALEVWNAGRFSLLIDFVDIDDDPLLTARYGERVPVLAAAGKELCAGRFDATALTTLAGPA